MADEQDHLFKHIIVLSFNLMMRLRVEAFGLEQLTAWSKGSQIRCEHGYLQRVTSPPNDTSMKIAQESLRKHMKRLDQELEKSGGPWVCGETHLADICSRSSIGLNGSILKRFETCKTTEWYDRVRLRPCFIEGVHPFRMWGPRNVEAHPFNDADYQPSQFYFLRSYGSSGVILNRCGFLLEKFFFIPVS